MDNSLGQQQSEFSNPNLEVFISTEAIRQRIFELGHDIAREYAGRNPLIIGLHTGALPFLSDLIRATDIRLDIQFMEVLAGDQDYRGEIRILKDLDIPIEGRHVVAVDVMVDNGLLQSYLLANLESRGAASVKLVAFLDIHERREREVPIDYLGFSIPDHTVVGYGVAFAERYRNLPFIAVLKGSTDSQLVSQIESQQKTRPKPTKPVTARSLPGLPIPSS